MTSTCSPYYDDLTQEISETSWLVLDRSTPKGLVIKFFNNDQAPPSHRFDSFQDFATHYIEQEFNFRITPRSVTTLPGSVCAIGSELFPQDDIHPHNARVQEGYGAVVQVLEIFDGVENLGKLLRASQQKFDDVQNAALEAAPLSRRIRP